jgi:hypothetical protein
MIFNDGHGSMSLLNNPIHHAHTKHINIQYHFVHEHITRKEMCKFSYYLTKLMVVDVLTKRIVKSQFEMSKEELGLNFSLNENVRNL